jgi:hypothetical protein
MMMKHMRKPLCALIAALLVLLPLCALAEGEPLSVEEVSDSIFRIATIDENGSVITLGTGFAIGTPPPFPTLRPATMSLKTTRTT